MMAKIMASRETKVIRRTKGYGSKIGMFGKTPLLASTQKIKKLMFMSKKETVPKLLVSQSAIFWLKGLFFKALASKLLMILLVFLILSLFFLTTNLHSESFWWGYQ